MASAVKPINREVLLPENELIVSKTDPQGNIIYCNRAFMRVSGYSEKDLLHTPHTLIRHPDMPRGIFRHLWQTLQHGSEYFGYIKNLNSDGSYCWLFSHIVADHDMSGNLRSYFSVRRRPRAEAVAVVEPIYKEMIDIENNSNKQDAPDRSLQHLYKRMQEYGTDDYESFILNI